MRRQRVVRRECDRCPEAPEFLMSSFFDNDLLCQECSEEERGCPNYGKPEFAGQHGTIDDIVYLIGALGTRDLRRRSKAASRLLATSDSR